MSKYKIIFDSEFAEENKFWNPAEIVEELALKYIYDLENELKKLNYRFYIDSPTLRDGYGYCRGYGLIASDGRIMLEGGDLSDYFNYSDNLFYTIFIGSVAKMMLERIESWRRDGLIA